MENQPEPAPDRRCENCACAVLVKHPVELNRTQLLCRKEPPMIVHQEAEVGGQRMRAMQLTYRPTSAELVCFDGWRPIGTLPGAPR